MIETISSPDDPRVADYVDVREADLVKRRGVFLVEGAEPIRTLISRSHYRPRSIFLSEKRLAAMAPVLERLPEEVPVYVAPQAVMNQVAGFSMHRGCIASAAYGPARGSEVADVAKTCVVLEAVNNHDNVGAIFRNALAFGAVVLLDPRTADPLYRKSIRVSMGAALLVPFGRASNPVAELKRRGFICAALTPGPDATDVRDAQYPEKVAFFLGTEGPGLDPETQNACDLRIRIPMAPGIDSLNVGTASGIALFSRYAPRR